MALAKELRTRRSIFRMRDVGSAVLYSGSPSVALFVVRRSIFVKSGCVFLVEKSDCASFDRLLERDRLHPWEVARHARHRLHHKHAFVIWLERFARRARACLDVFIVAHKKND